MIRTNMVRLFVLCFLVFGLAKNGLAQGDTARLQGTITDAADAAIAGATVTITRTETGRVQTAQTTDLGYYSVSALPAGHYRVEVSQQGFKKTVRELNLQVAQ